MHEVEMPNGDIIEFPGDISAQEIQSASSKYWDDIQQASSISTASKGGIGLPAAQESNVQSNSSFLGSAASSAANSAEQLYRGVASGSAGLGESFGGGLQWLGNRIDSESVAGAGKSIADYYKPLRESFAPPKHLQGNVMDDPSLLARGDWWTYQVGNLAPSLGAAMIPGAAVGKVVQVGGKAMSLTPQVIERLARIGQALGAGAGGGAMEGTSTYREVLEQGGSEKEAARAGETMALVSAGLNSLSFGKMLSKSGPGVVAKSSKHIGSGLVEGLSEWAEEPAESLSKDLAHYVTTGEMKPGVIERAKKAAREGVNVIGPAALTGVGGSLMSGGTVEEENVSDKDIFDKAADETIDLLNAREVVPTAKTGEADPYSEKEINSSYAEELRRVREENASPFDSASDAFGMEDPALSSSRIPKAKPEAQPLNEKGYTEQEIHARYAEELRKVREKNATPFAGTVDLLGMGEPEFKPQSSQGLPNAKVQALNDEGYTEKEILARYAEELRKVREKNATPFAGTVDLLGMGEPEFKPQSSQGLPNAKVQALNDEGYTEKEILARYAEELRKVREKNATPFAGTVDLLGMGEPEFKPQSSQGLPNAKVQALNDEGYTEKEILARYAEELRRVREENATPFESPSELMGMEDPTVKPNLGQFQGGLPAAREMQALPPGANIISQQGEQTAYDSIPMNDGRQRMAMPQGTAPLGLPQAKNTYPAIELDYPRNAEAIPAYGRDPNFEMVYTPDFEVVEDSQRRDLPVPYDAKNLNLPAPSTSMGLELAKDKPVVEDQPVIDIQAHEAATSPLNNLAEPSQAQKEAGNYKKAHVRALGMDIAIENPVGSERSGTDESGEPWSITMQHHYGYIKGTIGKDKDHLDIFLKDGAEASDIESKPVYIVDQVNDDGSFDEHKILAGFDNEQEAQEGYLSNYADGWQGIGAITEMTPADFKKWANSGKTTKPISYKRPPLVVPEGVNVMKSGKPYAERGIRLAVANKVKKGINAEAVQLDKAGKKWGWKEVGTSSV
ncbi:hypothetical protein, partial [Maridesulfovibrio ferrireducens]|uniref:hypothetical protein n=1 Tax=Maridesulfovibrio ferrireducens TaxID=246191 RepID=UPI001A206375